MAGGPWSRGLLSSVGVDVAISPVRGQIVLVSQSSKLLTHVLQTGPRYIVPRDDGHILIGATEENVGFVKANTASAVSALLAFGASRIPALAEARFERAWSGLGRVGGRPALLGTRRRIRQSVHRSRPLSQWTADVAGDCPTHPPGAVGPGHRHFARTLSDRSTSSRGDRRANLMPLSRASQRRPSKAKH